MMINDPRLSFLQACFDRLSTDGWDSFSYEALSKNLGISMDVLMSKYPQPSAFVNEALRLSRSMILEHSSAGGDLPYDQVSEARKDKLFEDLMMLFDVFAPMRPGIRVALKKITLSPCLIMEIQGDLFNALASILQGAGINTESFLGNVRVWAFGVGMLCMVQVWLDDVTEDLSKTMVSVDEKLGNLKDIADFIPFDQFN